jgi:hypothetical protein
LPTGPELPRALQNLKVTLDIIASEGAFALVVPICTIRDEGSNANVREKWVRDVSRLTRDFDNVFIEVANEPWHPKSKISRDELKRLLRVARGASGHLVGADENLGFASGRYRYSPDLRVDFPSFHTWRNPDPDFGDFKDIADQNGGWAVISETTAWGNEADVSLFGDLVTTSKDQITKLMDRCEAAGNVCFFHSVEGLAAAEYTWMPRR